MDLLGPSLCELHKFCGFKFSLKTTLLIGIQLLQRVQHMHDIGYINRDIKPGNLVMGIDNNSATLHLIDMGIAKRYVSESSGRHIPFRDDKQLVGTPCYASINSDSGIETSRRDDLESVFYTLVYLHTGFLPWVNIVQNEDILHLKKTISPEKICRECPQEFAVLLSYSKTLEFEEKPEYNMMIRMLENLARDRGINLDDKIYDWSIRSVIMQDYPDFYDFLDDTYY